MIGGTQIWITKNKDSANVNFQLKCRRLTTVTIFIKKKYIDLRLHEVLVQEALIKMQFCPPSSLLFSLGSIFLSFLFALYLGRGGRKTLYIYSRTAQIHLPSNRNTRCYTIYEAEEWYKGIKVATSVI